MRAELTRLGGATLATLAGRIRRVVDGGPRTAAQLADAIVDAMNDEMNRSIPGLVAHVSAWCTAGDGVAVLAQRGLAAPAGLGASSLVADVVALARRDPPREDRLGASVVVAVLDAATDPRVPAGFARHGVRAALAAAGRLPDGEVFALVMATTEPLSAGGPAELERIALQARVVLLAATDSPLDAARTAEIRANTLEDLLRLQEWRFARLVDQVAHERDEATARDTVHADQSRRAQRAMLNVIDDLREARMRLEQRVTERTIALEDRNRELEQFAYIASHDLQEPLRTIAGYLQLIEQRYADRLDTDAHDFIRFSVEGATRMQLLIDALLAYSRISQADHSLAPVPLDAVLDDVLAGLERSIAEADATIERTPLPTIYGDRTQLGQLLQNLVGNALKFRGEAPAHVAIGATVDGDRAELVVRDRGIGFDPRYADRIFGVFRRLQRKYPGTGIGLAICKKIAERHGGAITAESAPGQGAIFRVTLPVAPS